MTKIFDVSKERFLKNSEYVWVASWDVKEVRRKNWDDLIPNRVIFNDRATVCYFPDGDKVVVKCANGEQFSEEVGVQAAIMRKLFNGNRSKFLKIVEGAYRQPKNEKKEKVRVETPAEEEPGNG